MLQLVQMQMCESINGPKTIVVPSRSNPSKTYTVSGLFHERTWPKCTCPAYQFASRTVNFGGHLVSPHCKHIRMAEGMVCGWHEQFGESQTSEQREVHVCPRCGGPTVDVLVRV